MKHRSAKLRSHRGATEIAQFPMAIYCMFLVVLIPVLNLVTLLIAGTTAYLATNDLAAKAATQATFSQALNTMATEAYTFQSNTLARFVKMVPQGGYTGCGSDLFVLATDIGGSGVQSSVADQPLASNIDTTKSIYEMQVVSSYSAAPLVSMASFPLLGSIPGIGQPVTLSFAASRPIEHPGGMQTSPIGRVGGTVAAFNRIGSVATVTPLASANTWRTPNIYQQIQNAGETIVSQNVFMVQANNPNWTPSGVTVLPGQKLWIDTQAVGVWSPSGTVFQYDANGGPTSEWSGYYFNSPLQVLTQPMAALVAQIGTGGSPFLIGNSQTNYPCTGTGSLSMIFNNYLNCYPNGTGAQMVRVIVVQ